MYQTKPVTLGQYMYIVYQNQKDAYTPLSHARTEVMIGRINGLSTLLMNDFAGIG